MAHVILSSTVFAFLTNLSEECKSPSPSEIQVKGRWKTISIEEKLDLIIWLEKVEWIVDVYHNVRLAYSSVCTIRDYADRIKESAKPGTKVFVCIKTTTVLSEFVPETMGVSLLLFYCIRNKYLHCIEVYVYCIEMYIYCISSTYILYRSVCLMV